jgi:hypothetical protein
VPKKGDEAQKKVKKEKKKNKDFSCEIWESWLHLVCW